MSIRNEPHPPSWISRLLHSCLPSGVRGDSILGDLHQEYVGRPPGLLRVLWYLGASARLGLTYAPSVFLSALRDGMAGLLGGSTGADVRFALRRFRTRPAFPVIAVCTLALGIGATTAIFTVVDAALLRPLPYERPDEIHNVWNTYPTWRSHEVLQRMWDRIALSYPEYRRWRDEQTMFQGVAIYGSVGMVLTSAGEPVELQVGLASDSLFPLLGVRPATGRTFASDETGPEAAPLALLSHALWRTRLGGDPRVLGSTLSLDGAPFTVIGVLPVGFQFRVPGQESGSSTPDVWIPVGADGARLDAEGHHVYPGIARLAGGMPLAAAFTETEGILRGERESTMRSARITPKSAEERSAARGPLLLLLGAVSLLMVVGCANVAALMLGEVAVRRHEFATRAALGADGLRLVRQLLVESVILGVVGAAAGLAVAHTGVLALVRYAPATFPLPADLGLDLRVLLFSSGLGLLTGVAFGLLPALVAGRANVQGELRRGAQSVRPAGWRSQRALITAEVALALVLLVAGGLLARSLSAMFQVNPGFRADDLAVVRIQVPNDLASDDEASAFVAALAREITRVPGVQSVSGSSALPFSGRVHSSSFELEGKPAGAFGKHPEALRQSVLPGFHEVMGIPVLAGRDFRDTDVRSAPEVVMVSRSMARRYWPGESPLGRRIVRDDRTWEIVGVVGDVLHADLRTGEKPTFYFPYHQQPTGALSLVVRSQQDPAALLGPLQRAAWSLEPTLPIEEVGTVRSLLAGSAAGDRYRTFLLAAFGAAAALLTGVGIFAVTARAVARRTREFGIRMALGAAGPSIVRLVVRQEATALLLGVALGLAGALATGRLLSGFLFGVRADDPLTYLGATAFLLGLGLLASLLPARRTLRQEPSRVLRAE